MVNPEEIQQWAFFLASAGLAVIDCHLDRPSPVAGRWLQRATTNPETVAVFFDGARPCNLGVVPREGWIVIDLDRKNGVDGLESLEALAKEQGEIIPPTWTAHTPSGGLHLYFRYDGNRLKNWHDIAPGVDIRGKGGCVIAPPSEIESKGAYTWDPVNHPQLIEPAALPGWLESALIATYLKER